MGFPNQFSGDSWLVGLRGTDHLPEHRRIFSSREDLWRDHLFEPLLGWVNEDLAPATAIALFESGGGATWPKLVATAEATHGAAKVVHLAVPGFSA